MSNEFRSCLDCKFCVQKDYGYSNYTVEGTEVFCGKRLHPDTPFDRWYGEEPKLAFAKQCEGFEEGDAIKLDVDGDAFDDLTDEQRDIVRIATSKR